ncbi:MAG: phosphatase PAP2 family protein [Hyphomicrobium sp.]|uniref:phosphatase PAP2 family protein n=1 Tax=Hyphomicrobium sp. TaxID=82 RepID=UPI0039E297E9
MIKLLSPPPCDSCEQTKSEIEELRTLQRDRTEAQVQHALADYTISVAQFIEGAGMKFDAAALGKCQAIFDRLSARTKSAAEHTKNAFCRMRPYNLPDSGLKPLDAGKMSPSYPSGHTTYGTAVGAVLAQMIPEKRAEFYARAADYGHSRMIAGVHYRSDVEAGKLLGMAVAEEEFAEDDQFKSMFPEAAKCVRSALGLSPAEQASSTPGAGSDAVKPQ